MAWPPRRAVPGNRRLTLIGDPDGGRGLLPVGQFRLQLSQRRLDEGPDLRRVVLDEPRSRKVLGELPVGCGDDLAVVVDGDQGRQ